MRAKHAKVMELTGETIDARLLLKVVTDFRRGFGPFLTGLRMKQKGLKYE
jgi:hypothetical protein